MATLEFVKVTVGVLPASELLPHVEELVREGEGEWGMGELGIRDGKRRGGMGGERRRNGRGGEGRKERGGGKGGGKGWGEKMRVERREVEEEKGRSTSISTLTSVSVIVSGRGRSQVC